MSVNDSLESTDVIFKYGIENIAQSVSVKVELDQSNYDLVVLEDENENFRADSPDYIFDVDDIKTKTNT